MSPSGGFKLPKLPLQWSPIRTILTGIAAIAFVVAIIFGLGIFKNAPPELQPNAIWLGTEWTYEPRDLADVALLAQRLRENEIGTVYAWVSWLQSDNTWRGAENFDAVRNFVSQFNTAYPEARLYAWLGLPVNLGEDNYRLDDEEFQQRVATFSQTVVHDFGFDGVFLNVEPVWDGDTNFLDLLRVVRTSVGETASISVAIPPDWSPLGVDIPVPPLIEPGTVWQREYKQRVALLTDEMAVMAYNSGLSSPDDYVKWMAYQVESFASAVAELDASTNLVIGIPTYDAEPPAHDPAVENVTSAVDGIRTGLLQAGDAADFVRGVAIFAEWETDTTEWAQFNAEWVAK
ncbi:MAG: hypothetical protein D6737_02295 [Chloroflexi bacterium]|nr:MAG: hypothetical protein D6737_02295 [Chloroflexota bacterium]